MRGVDGSLRRMHEAAPSASKNLTWGLVGKGSIQHVRLEAERIAGILADLGQKVLWETELASAEGETVHELTDLDKRCDYLITVGGDGTILHTMQRCTKPVFGVNAGAVGFLAEVDPPMVEEGLQRVLAGHFTIEERPKLGAWLDDVRLSDALNEVTLQTSRIAKLIRFEVRVDGEVLDIFRGDGFIVSTPTGSTGYAMSVGAPLVHPKVQGTILAPIAPFKLASRPWVVPGTATVEIHLLPRDSAQGIQQARVVIDGQEGHDVDTGSIVRVAPSGHMALFVRLGSGFYERVRTKLTR